MRGGAERVLRILADLFPDAPIYTLLYDERKLGERFPRERVRTSRLQRFARLTTNHHWYLPFFPAAAEAWDFSAYDIVLSSSSAFAHGIITNGAPRHLCYVHSPARYLWDRTHEVLERAPLLSSTFHRLRTWDAEAAARPDRLLAASREVQRRIELYWRRDSDVVHPPIDDAWFQAPLPSPTPRDTYLVVSTLAAYKRIELAIEACARAGKRLTIVGEGPDRRRLQRLSGPTVTFLGYRPQEEMAALYANARATLFPGEEDFGLVPIESMACGTPVIAYRGGGALETLQEGTTGIFFDEPTGASLAHAIGTFEQTPFSPAACRAHAVQFGRAPFEHAILGHIEALLAAPH